MPHSVWSVSRSLSDLWSVSRSGEGESTDYSKYKLQSLHWCLNFIGSLFNTFLLEAPDLDGSLNTTEIIIPRKHLEKKYFLCRRSKDHKKILELFILLYSLAVIVHVNDIYSLKGLLKILSFAVRMEIKIFVDG
jgi:hypothetical protein